MKPGLMCVLAVLELLTGSSQAAGKDSSPGQSSVLPPAFIPATLPSHAGTSAFPEVTEDPGNEAPRWTHNPAGRDETSTSSTTRTQTERTVSSEHVTNAVLTTHLFTTSPAATTNAPVVSTALDVTPSSTAAADDLSSPPTGPQSTQTTRLAAPLTSVSPATFSSQPDPTVQEASSMTPSTTKPESDPSTTSPPQTWAPGRAPAGPTHQEVPSELNVGDEELKKSHHHSRSPLDPLLAGLLSVFIVTTAIVFVVLFLKFKKKTNHPEFHRLQDLPMEDLMEDTPLSRYSY